jgi:hypothetical protein
MGRRKSLVPDAEIARVIATLRACGVEIGAVDIRTDGVTVHPPHAPAPATLSAFDTWKAQDAHRDRPQRRL